MGSYISLFSGIGGLEDAQTPPVLACELDEAARELLGRRFPSTELHDDVTTLAPPSAEVVAGGWPCQDISVAGLRRGLAGERSGLFFQLLRVAAEAGARTIVAENVPNLLSLEGGAAFDLVLASLVDSGYEYVAWRTINAREFGLPHERRRVFIIASRDREIALALHRPLPSAVRETTQASPGAAGFYWTGGLQSICYSSGFVPTLKVGSALSIPSPPAVHFDNVVRKATAAEALRLQGFDAAEFTGIDDKHLYRMAGNAVAAPVGHWVFESLGGANPGPVAMTGFGYTAEHGFYEGDTKRVVSHEEAPLASNLRDVLDLEDREPLSERAAAGLLRRLVRSGKPCPSDLLRLLSEIARDSLEPDYRSAITTRLERREDSEGPLAADGVSECGWGAASESAYHEEVVELNLFG
jgi:DNA (cytosine-5)-methyltransferase 1